MAKTQTNCPRCKQPIIAEIEQIFDLNTDPAAKQRLLSGTVNFIHCPACGYEGMVGTPIVYHDPGKELLLTFFPPEMGVPINEQEKQLGTLINRVLNSLPAEKRKAYLLQPQSMLTYQTLLEKILEADGITKEMLDQQQQRLRLLQRLISSPKTDLPNLIKQEESLIDISFFSILSRLIQSAVSQQDEKTSQELLELQKILFEQNNVGKQLSIQAKDTEDAIKALQEASKDGLTREKLLDLIINSSNETKISTLVGLARSGMDYSFFQLLSNKIDSAIKEEKQKLLDLREKLLKLTEEIDKKVQEQYEETKKLIKTIISNTDIEESAEKNLSRVDDLFVQVLENELALARKNANLDRISKLERIMIIIEKASEPPAEVKLIQEFLSTKNDQDLTQKINENLEKITPELVDLLNNVLAQTEGKNQDPQIIDKLKEVNRAVLRASMQKNLKNG